MVFKYISSTLVVLCLAFSTLPSEIDGNVLFEKENKLYRLGVTDDFYKGQPSYSKPSQTRNVFEAPLGFNVRVRCNYQMHTESVIVRDSLLSPPVLKEECLDDFMYYLIGNNPAMVGATHMCGRGHFDELGQTVSIATSAGPAGVDGYYICRVVVVPAINLGLGGPLSSTPSPITSTGLVTPSNIANLPALSPVGSLGIIPDDPSVIIN